VDNLQKTVMDALKPFWRDDAQVVCGTPLNCFAEKDGRPRIVIRVRSAYLFDPNVMARSLGLLVPGGAFEMGREYRLGP